MRWRLFGLVCFLFLFPRSVFASLEISEVYANPIGDETIEEWIELWNSDKTEIATKNYILSDVSGSTKQFLLPELLLSAGETLFISRTQSGISLNNDGEQVVLKRPDGTMSSTPWFISTEGKSLALVDGSWIESSPSPNKKNEQLSTESIFGANSSLVSSQTSTTVILPTPSSSPTPNPSPALLPTSFFSELVPTASSTTGAMQVAQFPPVQLELSEINACGSPKEWVEIWNSSDQKVALDNWKLQDFSGLSHGLQGFVLDPHSYLVLEWKNGWLANAGDRLTLLWNDVIVDDISLPACSSDQSYVRLEGDWIFTKNSTPGFSNEFSTTIESKTASFFSATTSARFEIDQSTREVESDSKVSGNLNGFDKPNTVIEKNLEIQKAKHTSQNTFKSSALIDVSGDKSPKVALSPALIFGLIVEVSAGLILLGGVLLCLSEKEIFFKWVSSPEGLVNPWPKM